MNAKPLPCPCGSGRPSGACCARWHHGPQRLAAPDALALMRSRYSAYALGDVAYLLDTWHPRTRPAQLSLDPTVRWLGLEVRRHLAAPPPAPSLVEFVARSRAANGRAERLHETSRFVLEGGRWLYLDGDLHQR